MDIDAPAEGLARVPVSLAIAARSRSRLMRVARTLDVRRLTLFCPAYASMRVIDDLVDDDLPDPARALTPGDARAALEMWLSDCRAALQGGALSPAAHPAIRELATVAPGTGLSDRPWALLAGALAQDIAGHAPADWAEFEAYTAGASGGPTEAFLLILSLGAEQVTLDGARRDLAATSAPPLALYCYLVHIARDLALDAVRDPRLVSVPDAELTAHGLDKSTLRQAARVGDAATIARVTRAVLDRAETMAGSVEGARRAMEPVLDEAGRAGLNAIIGAYRDLAAEIAADPVAHAARALRGEAS